MCADGGGRRVRVALAAASVEAQFAQWTVGSLAATLRAIAQSQDYALQLSAGCATYQGPQASRGHQRVAHSFKCTFGAGKYNYVF